MLPSTDTGLRTQRKAAQSTGPACTAGPLLSVHGGNTLEHWLYSSM